MRARGKRKYLLFQSAHAALSLWLSTLHITTATTPTRTLPSYPHHALRQDIPPPSPTVPLDIESPPTVTVIQTESSTTQEPIATTSLNPEGVNDAVPTADVTGEEGETVAEATGTGTESSQYPEISTPSQIGMIMPNPDSAVYAGVTYTFGYIDNAPINTPPQPGILRQITPLITFPNYSTSVFPTHGNLLPNWEDHINDTLSDSDFTQLEYGVAEGSDFDGYGDWRAGWCSVDLRPRARRFSFRFEEEGWHMFILNATWARMTIDGPDSSSNCSLPYVDLYSFFATQTVSVRALPTFTPTSRSSSSVGSLDTALSIPDETETSTMAVTTRTITTTTPAPILSPPPAYTLWTNLDWKLPGPLPAISIPDTNNKKIIAALSVVGVIVAIAVMAAVIWLVRRKRKAEMENLAISRLPPEERAQFLHPYTTPAYREPFPAETRPAGMMRDEDHPKHYMPVGMQPRMDYGYDPRVGPPMTALPGGAMQQIGWRNAMGGWRL